MPTHRGTTPCTKGLPWPGKGGGHELSDDNLVPSSAKKGKRDCLECSHEKTELIRAARTKLRLTRRAYVAVYGQSRAAAEAVLAQ